MVYQINKTCNTRLFTDDKQIYRDVCWEWFPSILYRIPSVSKWPLYTIRAVAIGLSEPYVLYNVLRSINTTTWYTQLYDHTKTMPISPISKRYQVRTQSPSKSSNLANKRLHTTYCFYAKSVACLLLTSTVMLTKWLVLLPLTVLHF
jgi:hypothetical protein